MLFYKKTADKVMILNFFFENLRVNFKFPPFSKYFECLYLEISLYLFFLKIFDFFDIFLFY